LFLYYLKTVILSEVARAFCELRSRRTPKSSICRYKTNHFNLQILAAPRNMRIGRKGLRCRGNIETLRVLRLRVPKGWDAPLRMTILRQGEILKILGTAIFDTALRVLYKALIC